MKFPPGNSTITSNVVKNFDECDTENKIFGFFEIYMCGETFIFITAHDYTRLYAAYINVQTLTALCQSTRDCLLNCRVYILNKLETCLPGDKRLCVDSNVSVDSTELH